MPDYWTPGQPWDARLNGSEQQRIYAAAHNPGSQGGPRGLVLPQNPLGLDPAARSNRLAQERLAAQIAAPIAGARGLTAAQRNQLVALSGQQQNALHNEQNALHNAAALAGQQHIAAQNNAAALAQTGMREAGQNARAAAQTALAAQNLDLERATKMPALLAARRMEALHQRYEESQNPQDREAIAQQIRHLSGQAGSNPRDEWITVGGGQEFDEAAGVMRNVPQRLFNVRTREFLGQPSGAQENTGAGQAPPPDGTVLTKDGKKYVMSGGAAVPLDGPT